MFDLVYSSPYTTYTIDTYSSIEDCMIDCVRRYGCMCIFKREDCDTFKAKIYGEDEITLTLRAQEGIVVLKLYEDEVNGAATPPHKVIFEQSRNTRLSS